MKSEVIILIFLSSLISFYSSSQNLVPNPSFEDVNCPTGYTGWPNQIEKWVNYWYAANCTSPDPMTNCSNFGNTSVPDVWFGHQEARTGTNYLGFSFYYLDTIPWYEYVGTQLISPLKAGKFYNVSFWLSCADKVRYASDAVGIYFSDTIIKCEDTLGMNGAILSFTPQIRQKKGVFIKDTTNWVQISGTYKALGGEKYIIIGCFEPLNENNIFDFGTGNPRCYYYLDDISVTESLSSIKNENIYNDKFIVTPSIIHSNNLDIKLNSKNKRKIIRINIFNLNGCLMKSIKNNIDNSISIDVSNLTPGMYLLQFLTDKRAINKKFIKLK